MVLSLVPEGALVFDAKAATTATEKDTSEPFPWEGVFSWGGSNKNTGMLSGKPGVYIMGDGYAIIWVTTFNGTGTVVFKDGGKVVSVSDKRTGIMRTNDTIHVVKLSEAQYKCIQTSGYYIVSREVTTHEYAITNYGSTVIYGLIDVAATPTSTNMNITVLTDIHGKESEAKTTATTNFFQTFK
jgi:hypothetical protein